MRRFSRGFTLIELMVTIAIIGIIAALAYPSIARQRPRASLMGTTADLFALLRNARQNALTTGRDTVVLVLPAAANTEQGRGRIVVIEDPSNTFFDEAGTPNFTTFDQTRAVDTGNLIGEVRLPRGITIGLGGATAPTLPPPYSLIPSGACTFCAAGGNGAIVFDSRGHATFHNALGPALQVMGGTIALQSAEVNGYRLLAITSGTGLVWALNAG